jgi:hypothetical protein
MAAPRGTVLNVKSGSRRGFPRCRPAPQIDCLEATPALARAASGSSDERMKPAMELIPLGPRQFRLPQTRSYLYPPNFLRIEREFLI